MRYSYFATKCTTATRHNAAACCRNDPLGSIPECVLRAFFTNWPAWESVAMSQNVVTKRVLCTFAFPVHLLDACLSPTLQMLLNLLHCLVLMRDPVLCCGVSFVR